MSPERDIVFDLRPHNIPWIAVAKPEVRLLNLITIFYRLIKYTVVISDSISHSRNTEGSHRIQKTGGKAPQSSVTKSGVPLGSTDLIIIKPVILHSLATNILHPQADHQVSQQPAVRLLQERVLAPFFYVVVI